MKGKETRVDDLRVPIEVARTPAAVGEGARG